MTATERLAAWDESPAWAANPMSPAKREAYRIERQRAMDNPSHNLPQRLSMYQASKTRAAALAPVLNESHRLKDVRVQAMMDLAGQLPTAMGQRADRCVANNNTLRFVRDAPAGGIKMPADGGPLYGITTLEGNWVEETRDRAHRSEWHVKELRRNKLRDTEHTASYVMHSPEYASKVLRAHLVASVGPSIQLPALPGTDTSDGLLHYGQDGFGEELHQDHTTDTKRGGHWVGIAPLRQGRESVTTTVHGHGDYLEFQMRTATSDSKAKFLGTHPTGNTKRVMDPWTVKAFEDLAASERCTAAWRSIYVRDYQDVSKGPVPRATTSLGHRHAAGSVSSLVRPQTSGGQ